MFFDIRIDIRIDILLYRITISGIEYIDILIILQRYIDIQNQICPTLVATFPDISIFWE